MLSPASANKEGPGLPGTKEVPWKHLPAQLRVPVTPSLPSAHA